MPQFEHQRHKPPAALDRSRELVLACAPLRSNVNLSRIVRAASCCGVTRIITTGQAKIDPEIARDGATAVQLEPHRSLAPMLKKLKSEGFRIVGLEQTSNSASLYDYRFERKTLLVIGNERSGLTDDLLAAVDDVVEIPVYGLPYSFNVGTATAIAVYEYCRQFPRG
jgi:tRNA G18 (ribose-2'-O)-methylase SpoU